jgi:hypothetical protein
MPGSVLVLFDTPTIVAGVLRDRFGNTCLGAWPPGADERPLTVLDGGIPATIGGPTWTALGGLLPQGAVSVEIRDAEGKWHQGAAAPTAWAGVIPGDVGPPPAELPPIRFRDGHGEIISRLRTTDCPRPIAPSDLARLRRAGFDERCPVCSQDSWGLLRPSAGMGDRVTCSRCGYTDGALRGFYGVE